MTKIRQDLGLGAAPLERLFEHSRDLMAIISHDGFFRVLNPAWEQSLGWRVDEMLDQPAARYLHPDDLLEARKVWGGIKEGGGPRDLVNRYGHKDGSTRWLAWTATKVDGWFYAVARDITAQRESERAIGERDEMIRAFYDLSQMFMGIVDVGPENDAIHVSCNRAAAAVVQRTPEEMIGHGGAELGVPQSYMRYMVERFRESQHLGRPFRFEHATEMAPVTRWVATTVCHIGSPKPGFERFAYVSGDVTDLKQQEEMLREQQARLVTASKLSALGEMAAGIAHEINNPLTIIRGKAEVLARSIKDRVESERDREDVRAILAMTARISNIVGGMRRLSRDGESDPRQAVAVRSIVADALSVCAERFRLNGVTLERPEVAETLMLECRAVQIGQVLVNLLSNAFAAVAGREAPWVRVAVLEREGSLELAVEDNGSGVAPELREKVFQPFFTTKEAGQGTGLGLSISRRLVEQDGGTLVLDSGVVGVTRFVVRLPWGEVGG